MQTQAKYLQLSKNANSRLLNKTISKTVHVAWHSIYIHIIVDNTKQ